MTEYDVFISYRRLDMPRVDLLVEALRAQGLSVWLDRADIADYAAITRAITEGLAHSKAVLAWYSKHYPLSRPCQWELTAAYLAAQQAGDPRQRVLIVNPETSPDHIALPELKDQQYLSAPAMDDRVGYDDLAKRIAAQVQGLTGTLGDIRPLVIPSWFPYTATGSARFVGRLRHMWQMHDQLWCGQTVIGQLKLGTALAQLVGGGGMGKSLLAEEYALRYGAAYPGGVFWLSARTAGENGVTADTLNQQREQQWRNVAAWLGIEIKDKSQVQIEGELHKHFADKNQPFLWVIDDVPADVPIQDLRGWVAPHAHGKTLLTTRSHEYQALGGRVEVGVLAEAEARSLLTQQRPPADEAEAAAVAEILRELGYHALAVDVTAARLKSKPYLEFLNDLRHPDKDALELAKHFSGQLPNGHEASIATMLLQSIAAVSEETRNFLRLAAVLAIAPIPRRLVARVFAVADGLSDSDALDRADLALHEAQEQSLAEATGDTDFSVTVHVLVTRTMRFHGANSDRSIALCVAAKRALTDELAEHADDIRNHAALAHWIEHASSLVVGTYDDLATIELCTWVARYDPVRRERAAARAFLGMVLTGTRALEEGVLEVNRRVLGEEHPDTLASMNSLASTLWNQGDLEGARTLEEEVLEVSRRVLGEEHPDTLASMSNLAITLFNQGDLEGARVLEEEMLAVGRRVLGGEHPDTLASMSNLVSTLFNQGNLMGARVLEEEVLAVSRRVLGEEHPDTLVSMSNLATILFNQGDLAGACALGEEVLEVSHRVLGEEGPGTLASMSNLASILFNQGDLAGARALEEKVLVVRCRVLGEEHPDTLISMNNLASTRGNQGDLAGARALQGKVLAVLSRMLGEEHPNTLTSMNNLALTLRDQGDLAGARVLEEKVLEVRRRVLGEKHPDTTAAAWNHLLTLRQAGLHDQAALLAHEHLAWLMDSAPETLSANQRQIRDSLGEIATEEITVSQTDSPTTTQLRNKP
ncbi:MAG: tetratricopeptide repeat protein [Gammaproteobacteria bacterium]